MLTHLSTSKIQTLDHVNPALDVCSLSGLNGLKTFFFHFCRTSPQIPEIHVPEEAFLVVASSLRNELNQAFVILRSIALGRDLKKFLMVVVGLWIISVVGNWFNFLTLVYICFVILHTVPMLYEKHEDKVDPLAEKAMKELQKQYVVFDEKVLSKIPIASLKAKAKLG
jgi:hypothetical protein